LAKIRLAVQFIWTLITNSYLIGFVQGKIYTGPIKHVCVPGLNCYSCPGAIGSCPIGALQAVVGSWKYKVSLYMIGFFMIVGAFCGRFVCGWLCPFGLVQDLLYKIPFIAKIETFKGDRSLRWLKYGILAVFVLIMPMFITDVIGQGNPYFCKLICPSGLLFGGIPLVAANESLREAAGMLFAWKSMILAIVLIGSVVLYRPFCKYVCPLGAIYALFNKVSMVQLQVDLDTCVKCGKCARACKMNVAPYKNPADLECIRCGECIGVCPVNAISMGVKPAKKVRPLFENSTGLQTNKTQK
jgi:polyferredoxin